MRHHPKYRRLLWLITLASVLGAIWIGRRVARNPVDADGVAGQITESEARELLDQVRTIAADQKREASTIWLPEYESIRFGRVFIDLWDRLNRADDAWRVMDEVVPPQIVLGRPATHSLDAHQLEQTTFRNEPVEVHDRIAARAELRRLRIEGYHLDQSEWRHTRFDRDPGTGSIRSVVSMTLHVGNRTLPNRFIVHGDLIVNWSVPPLPSDSGSPTIQSIDARDVSILRSPNPPGFRQTHEFTVAPFPGSWFIDPLILRDLDGDGLSEIILACGNQLFWNRGDWRFERVDLCEIAPGLIFTGAILDVNLDGLLDFIAVDREGLLLYHGEGMPPYTKEPVRCWNSPGRLRYAQALTAADIDGDGDLDLWLGQYKVPYERGQMPTPFYDARDGHPSYLLINDGTGRFHDATANSGLDAKRNRRTYSASFVDVDDDLDFDLFVVSDFAGADLYQNDGGGRFIDVTERLLGEPLALGMSHAFGDFNADANMDMIMIGMNSPAASRLDHFGIGHPDHTDDKAMRPRVTFGNRAFLKELGPDNARPAFRQPAPVPAVQHTGWSWGVTAADFDNNGTVDLAIANGHETRSSVEDFERHFWCHDIYRADSSPDPATDLWFRSVTSKRINAGVSYGGNEKNRLLLNLPGHGWTEVAYLLGTALEADSRNMVGDDLDGDGRMDLLTTTFEVWPVQRQRLILYRNELTDPTHHWIGFIAANRSGKSSIGLKARLFLPNGASQIRQFVTGESFRSQHAPNLHFGLGSGDDIRVDRVEFTWPNGARTSMEHPAIDRYHRVAPPDQAAARSSPREPSVPHGRKTRSGEPAK